MSKWKLSVKPKGALQGHFLSSSGWKTEAQRKEPALRATRVGSTAGSGNKRGLPPTMTSVFAELGHRVAPVSETCHLGSKGEVGTLIMLLR